MNIFEELKKRELEDISNGHRIRINSKEAVKKSISLCREELNRRTFRAVATNGAKVIVVAIGDIEEVLGEKS